ncbi:RNA polymerase I-specific transcription initiation factor-domain-containing protein, partial [Sordaria sp. MPI-SDFR-AT-0083]
MSTYTKEESEDEDWDKDTEEINSIASDELHETRPNRWNGPPSTWLTFTAQERKAYQALEGLRRRDLPAHLYNAHALKTRVKRQKTEQVINDQSEDEQVPRPRENEWAPSHRWTAWPLKTGEVVDDELLPRTVDEHEDFTLRGAVQTFPSKNLEEEISATILRCAKEKFRGRGFPAEDDEDEQAVGEGHDGVVDSIETGDNDPDHHHAESSQLLFSPSSRRNDESSRYSVPLSSPVKGEPLSQDESSKQNGSSSQVLSSSRQRRPRAPTPTYVPVPSIDDDRSYKLLRPATRRILSKLDETLTILHNARVAGLRDLSESSASDTEDNDNEAETEGPSRQQQQQQQQQQRTRRGRRRARSPSPSADESKSNPRSTSKRGRKRKIRIPLEGETEEEMLDRIARETHKRIPSLSRKNRAASSFHTTDDDDDGDETASEADTEAEPPKSYQMPSKKATTKRHTKDRNRSRSRSRSVTSNTTALTAVQEKDRQERVARWGLRDWRDVLGAAALAGFPQSVIARATQRCTNLFGEEMTMHTLSSSSSSSSSKRTQTTTYRPGDPVPESSDSETDTTDIELEQRRTVSRQPSLVRTLSPDEEEEEDGEAMEGVEAAASEAGTERSGSASRAWGRSRSRSRARRAGTPAPGVSGGLRVRRRSVTPAAGGGVYFCPYPDCERAIEGFGRRANMHRHLKLVHGRSPPSSPAGSVVGGAGDDDQDSMDEMEEGVHLDGFLQPIKV